jgi:hypothetical protein
VPVSGPVPWNYVPVSGPYTRIPRLCQSPNQEVYVLVSGPHPIGTCLCQAPPKRHVPVLRPHRAHEPVRSLKRRHVLMSRLYSVDLGLLNRYVHFDIAYSEGTSMRLYI